MRILGMAAVLSLMVLPGPVEAQESVVGTWKLVSFVRENVGTKKKQNRYGEQAKGYLVITADRLTAILTGADRKAPKSDEDRAASFRTMFAYTGSYRVEGNRLITKVDVAWNEAWVGTDQVRIFRLEGDKLILESEPTKSGTATSKGISQWTRVK